DGGNLQAVDAVFGRDGGKDNDKGARGAGNLQPRTATQGNNHTGHNGVINPLFGFGARGDGETHGQGQGDHADDNPGNNIAEPVATAKQSSAMGFKYGQHSHHQGKDVNRIIIKF